MSGVVMIFTFVSVIFLHNYKKFEKPVIAVSTSFVTSEFDKTTVDSVKYCNAETLKVGLGFNFTAKGRCGGDGMDNITCQLAFAVCAL